MVTSTPRPIAGKKLQLKRNTPNGTWTFVAKGAFGFAAFERVLKAADAEHEQGEADGVETAFLVLAFVGAAYRYTSTAIQDRTRPRKTSARCQPKERRAVVGIRRRRRRETVASSSPSSSSGNEWRRSSAGRTTSSRSGWPNGPASSSAPAPWKW